MGVECPTRIEQVLELVCGGPWERETGELTLTVGLHAHAKHLVCICLITGSVAQSCPTLCDPVDCSTPGLPVHHQLPEFTQTHVH